eukprot:gnl/TRDRNA2_/TRDRNA2_144962_c0_seq1.p1 gnl/TRDRNA2_/TRDRNA2_144962_c0~~gnl/TRDRNA2_/TRDRNA2_144962_c0_seq1.p1  ORF type:complete len:1023 (-),score=161.85 gnl/TRDRNA2_/TRDRNA2_144962_c0_seq1:96-2921(-)
MEFEVFFGDQQNQGPAPTAAGSCSLRLSWVEAQSGHACGTIVLDLYRPRSWLNVSPAGTAVLRLGAFCLPPAAAAPPPTWVNRAAAALGNDTDRFVRPPGRSWEPLGRGVKLQRALGRLPSVPANWPCAAQLEFVVVGFWDLAACKVPPKLAFRIEASATRAGISTYDSTDEDEELILLNEASAVDLLEPFKLRSQRGVAFEMCRICTCTAELPRIRAAGGPELVVLALDPDGIEEHVIGEARLPLVQEWPYTDMTKHWREVEARAMLKGHYTESRVSNHSFEASTNAYDTFGKAVLLTPGSSPDVRLAIPGALELDPFAVPGAIGIMKCAYRLVCEPASDKESTTCSEAPVESVHTENEEEEKLPCSESAALKATAARHTHNVGYKRWESFDVESAIAEIEQSDNAPAGAPPATTAPVPATPTASTEKARKPNSSARMQEKARKLVADAGGKEQASEPTTTPSVDLKDDESMPLSDFAFDGSRLCRRIEASRRDGLILRLYIHRAFVLLQTAPRLYFEVSLGNRTVASLGARPAAKGPSALFRYWEEFTISLPEQGRLEIRVFDADGTCDQGKDCCLGSTVVDLQDRWMSHELRAAALQEFNRPRETRTVWSATSAPLRAVGSLEMWLGLTDPDDPQAEDNEQDPNNTEEELWPPEPLPVDCELRVTLGNVELFDCPGVCSRSPSESDVRATIELRCRAQRVLGGGELAPHHTDIHWNLRREGPNGYAVAEFQWRAIFAGVHYMGVSTEAAVVIAVWDERSSKLVGEARVQVVDLLSKIHFGAKYKAEDSGLETSAFRSQEVLDADGRCRGRANFTIVALNEELAYLHPAVAGRAAVPCVQVEPPASTLTLRRVAAERKFGDEELHCPMRGRRRRDRLLALGGRRRSAGNVVVILVLFFLGTTVISRMWSALESLSSSDARANTSEFLSSRDNGKSGIIR